MKAQTENFFVPGYLCGAVCDDKYTLCVCARAKSGEDVMSRPRRQTATRSPLVRKRAAMAFPRVPGITYHLLRDGREGNVRHPLLQSNSTIPCNDGTRSLLGSITPPARSPCCQETHPDGRTDEGPLRVPFWRSHLVTAHSPLPRKRGRKGRGY